MSSKNDKTNATRKLDSKKITYKEFFYTAENALSGVEVAALLNEAPEHVFKTLVTTGKSTEHYVFIIPAAEELDLKKAARVVGEKSIEMLKSRDLLGLTGYIHGGCSPVGMKKQFKTVIHNSAKQCSTVIVSGGRIGYQIELTLEQLQMVLPVEAADLTVD